MDDEVPAGPAGSPARAVEGSADAVPEPQAAPPAMPPAAPGVTDRRGFMRSVSADTVATAGRFYGLGGVLRRSLGAAGGALVAELESMRGQDDPGRAADPSNAVLVAAGTEPGEAPDPPPASAVPVPPAGPAGPPATPSVSVAPRHAHTLTPAQAALLADADTLVMAVNRRSGSPQLTTAWFDWDGEHFRISTTRSGLRADLVRADPRVTLFIEDPATGQTAIAEGVAELCEGRETGDETRPILRKYLTEADVETAWAELNATFDRIVIRVAPDRLLFIQSEGLLGRPGRRPSGA